MDKTIEIVVVAMVALVVATILLFLVQDRTDNFSGFLEGQQSNAQCELWKTQGKCGKASQCSWSQGECLDSGGACPSGKKDCAGYLEKCIPEDDQCPL